MSEYYENCGSCNKCSCNTYSKNEYLDEYIEDNYTTIEYCSKNENGFPEITVEKRKTFFQWLFRRQATVITYVFLGEKYGWATVKHFVYDKLVNAKTNIILDYIECSFNGGV